MQQVSDYLTIDEIAERLRITPGRARQLVREVGGEDTVRLNSGELLVPVALLERLRAACPH